jgi:ubiquinone biosynthesis protein
LTTAGRSQQATPRATLKRRRDEVVGSLAACGLARGPHRVVRGAAGGEGTRAGRLRVALTGLGPIFSSFGLYLATRVDLLRARDCQELAAIPDGGAPATPAAVRDLFRRELGYAPEEAFGAFAYEPFECRLLYQAHRARLPNGAPVVVKIIRPESEQQFLCDAELLHLLEGALVGVAPGGAPFQGAVGDFVTALRQQMDFTHEAQALEVLARDAEEFEMLRAPAVYRGLCSRRVLTVEELAGVQLDGAESAAPVAAAGAAGGRPDPRRAYDHAGRARLLCAVWLRQALLGHVFPVEPRPDTVIVLPNRQIVFTSGLFASLPCESQSNLWNYLLAAAAEDPDGTCACLLREFRQEGPPGGDEELRHRFRQIVPFRDSEWYFGGEASRLAEHLVVHWRAAAKCGYVPRPHLPPFYRGLFAVARAAQQLSPGDDPLLEGLQYARLLASLAPFREMMSLHRLGEQADKYAVMMMELPRQLDEVLHLTSGGSPRIRLRMSQAEARGRRKNSTVVAAAMLPLLTAVALLLPDVLTQSVGDAWAGRISAVIFVALGAALLRTLSRAE